MDTKCKHPYINETTLTEHMVQSNFQDEKSIEQGYDLLCNKCKRKLAGQWKFNDACRRFDFDMLMIR